MNQHKEAIIVVAGFVFIGLAYFTFNLYTKALNKSLDQLTQTSFTLYNTGIFDNQLATRKQILMNTKRGECQESATSTNFYLIIK